ncbi:MAG: hypothetical protein EON92_04110 [Burkholderiales bacterium]|nr:MAG: hypothetical protein EON92_04110 [Burkholderiales bacterium]
MMAPVIRTMQTRSLALGIGMLVMAAAAVAQTTAGEVEFSRGVGFAQTPGQTPRTLGKGLPLREGDRLTTSEGGSAIIKLEDGTRMTVRPNSELVLQQYKFAADATDNSLVMQLLRGGMRAVTGLIAKSSPNAARIQTNTATIGIRGTDFDARVCARDCGTESAKVADKSRPNAVQASAKVVSAQGQLEAVDGGGTRRRLVDGGSVYPGDLVETAAGTRAVLAFRDDSRVTLGSGTRFRVDNFVYDDKNPGEGRFLVSLLRGSVRALTGLIGKTNTRNVGFATATATVGIRGTGLDLDCNDNGCSYFTWLGSIVVTPNGGTALDALLAGQGLFVGQGGIRPLTGSTIEDLPRPDGVTVDVKQLFSSNDVAEDQEGLFVFVRDGHIEIATTREILHLGKGEAGFAGDNGSTARPNQIPKFLDFDKMPLPNSRNPMLSSLLGESGIRASNQCN